MSKIEWTEKTWNPIIGCTKISPGCKNCFAERMANRLNHIELSKYGAYSDKRLYRHVVEGAFKGAKWNGTTMFIEERIHEPLRWKKPRIVFVCSMGDLFHESVSFRLIDMVFSVIAKTPQHTYQILTKRPEIMKKYFKSRGIDKPLLNVWLGVTVENQDQVERVRLLIDTPAVVRFVSCEPLLSAIDFEEYYFPHRLIRSISPKNRTKLIDLIDQVICGGETGHGSRPVHIQWLRSLRDQCIKSNTPFFFKSWGDWAIEIIEDQQKKKYINLTPTGKNEVLLRDPFLVSMKRVGKKKAGNLLDGKVYNQYPIVK